jgi:phosphoribosylaminoimidazolecarboxamide formyltransferase/IMP cyclohydrolase
VDLARGLAAHGIELLSTGGTAAALRDAGLAVRDVSEETGFPEMLEGRVKTLHPRLFAGILARGGREDDAEAIAAHGIRPIELVAVNLYPFEAAAARAARLPDDALEQIDIGGPSLLRAAAKNFASVAVLCDPATYAAFLEELGRGGGAVGGAVRRDLAGRAFAHTAAYDVQVAAAFGAGRPESLPASLATGGRRVLELRYGENPHQRAAFYAEPPRRAGLAAATLLQGKALSYTNLLDLDAAWAVADEVRRTLPSLEQPATGPSTVPPGAAPEARIRPRAACAIVKHATPCGVGTGAGAAAAYARARATDPVSAFGGVCVLTVAISAEMVEAAAEHFLEVLAAPSVDPAAREALARKPNLRVLELPAERVLAWDARRVAGGLLVQEADHLPPLAPESLEAVTGALTPELREALSLAWAVVKHVKSNAIVFGDRAGTLGIGAGQMSRVDAVELAVRKAEAAGHALAGSVAASDAFFPFRDGLDAAARAGAVAVIQPGGSKRDAEVIAAAAGHGIALVHTGRRHFRH